MRRTRLPRRRPAPTDASEFYAGARYDEREPRGRRRLLSPGRRCTAPSASTLGPRAALRLTGRATDLESRGLSRRLRRTGLRLRRPAARPTGGSSRSASTGVSAAAIGDTAVRQSVESRQPRRRVAGHRAAGARRRSRTGLHPFRSSPGSRHARSSAAGHALARRSARPRGRRDREHALPASVPGRRHPGRLPAGRAPRPASSRPRRSTSVTWWSKAGARADDPEGLDRRVESAAGLSEPDGEPRAGGAQRVEPRLQAAQLLRAGEPAGARRQHRSAAGDQRRLRCRRRVSARREPLRPHASSEATYEDLIDFDFESSCTSTAHASKPRESSSAARSLASKSARAFDRVDVPGRRGRDQRERGPPLARALREPEPRVVADRSLAVRLAGARRGDTEDVQIPVEGAHARRGLRGVDWRRVARDRARADTRAASTTWPARTTNSSSGSSQPGRRARIGVEYGFR